MRRTAAGFLLVTLVLVATAATAVGRGDVTARLEAALARNLRAHPSMPGEAAAVQAPGVRAAAAVGLADPDAGTALTPDTPFRIASVTKTFVAATVLRLVEQGTLVLDAPIASLLDPATDALLRGDGYRTDVITVRQLLDHTSGLYDYATSDAYDALNTSDPGRHWTAVEQLQFAMDHGDPLAAPGVKYHYADTNYVLLGQIVARITGESLPAAVRRLVGFERLGLDQTWWEQLEPARTGLPARAHQLYDDTFDNITLDASADLYGGGGLVSTVGDVTTFFRALFDGRVFDHDATLDEMLTVSKPGRRAGAALGIYRATIGGVRCYGHPGYWGTEAYACPALDAAFTIATNQADETELDTTPVQQAILALAR
ncbi:MAG: serine hydrolase domain-containing protein [Acidimicrobiia bacterium]